jgi:hypothetical protein
MRIKSYPITFAVSALLAAALLLGDRPLGRDAGRAVQAAPATAASLAPISRPEGRDEVAARRQAIEDVLPLMRSLEARGDTVRLVQLARSVLTVWSELDALDPTAMSDERLRERVEYWANAPLLIDPLERVYGSGN